MATPAKKQARHQYHAEKKKNKRSIDSSKHEFSLPQLLLDEDADKHSHKSHRSKSRKLQEPEEFVNSALSNKILREAQRQQKDIQKEKDEESGVAAVRAAFASVQNDVTSDEEGEDNDFSDSQSFYGEFEEVPEEEEKILALFMAEKAGPQKTLADLIMLKIQEKDSTVRDTGERPVPAVDAKVIEVYRGVGKLMSRYTSGKVPKAFKIIPSLSNWEEVLYLTEPENWSACAMYQATRIFASNLNAKMAQRFYNLVLLPRVRDDINSNKRLHFALYQALKKAVYKPSAFYKGVLLPLCQSRTCNLREAVIIGSVIQKVSIPSLHSRYELHQRLVHLATSKQICKFGTQQYHQVHCSVDLNDNVNEKSRRLSLWKRGRRHNTSTCPKTWSPSQYFLLLLQRESTSVVQQTLDTVDTHSTVCNQTGTS